MNLAKMTIDSDDNPLLEETMNREFDKESREDLEQNTLILKLFK